jgi:hypothetical protein
MKSKSIKSYEVKESDEFFKIVRLIRLGFDYYDFFDYYDLFHYYYFF